MTPLSLLSLVRRIWLPGRIYSSILMRIHLPRYQVQNRIQQYSPHYLDVPLGHSGGGGGGGGGDVCHGCVDAGHLVKEPPSSNFDDLVGDAAVDKPTIENGVKEPVVENQPTEQEPGGQKLREKDNWRQQQPVEEPEINAQSENVANNQRSDLVDEEEEIDGGKGPVEEGPSAQVPEAKTNNPSLLHQTDQVDQTKPKSDSSEGSQEKKPGEPVMSSKLSVTSLASGESLASFSFSADSLGETVDWIVSHQYLMRKTFLKHFQVLLK